MWEYNAQAGVMAKILGKNPNYTPAQLKQYLLATYVQLIIMNIISPSFSN